MDPKSGCNISNKKTIHAIKKNGTKPSKKLHIECFFFFAKYASMITSHIFMNSTGCIDGNNGILSHHFAPLYSSPINNTAISNPKVIPKITFAYFSRSE
jgi:hypothetical protein